MVLKMEGKDCKRPWVGETNERETSGWNTRNGSIGIREMLDNGEVVVVNVELEV